MQAQAIEARQRVFGLSRDKARSEMAETVFGRLALTGELIPKADPGETPESNARRNHEAYAIGLEFFRARKAYLKAIRAQGILSGGDMERVRGHDASDGKDPAYVAQCTAAERTYTAMRNAILDHGGALCFAVIEAVVSDDVPMPGFHGELRMALNALRLDKERRAKAQRRAA